MPLLLLEHIRSTYQHFFLYLTACNTKYVILNWKTPLFITLNLSWISTAVRLPTCHLKFIEFIESGKSSYSLFVSPESYFYILHFLSAVHLVAAVLARLSVDKDKKILKNSKSTPHVVCLFRILIVDIVAAVNANQCIQIHTYTFSKQKHNFHI